MNNTDKECRIARLLNDASACGLKNQNLTQLIDDYFNASDGSGSESEGFDTDYEDIPKPPTSATSSPSETK